MVGNRSHEIGKCEICLGNEHRSSVFKNIRLVWIRLFVSFLFLQVLTFSNVYGQNLKTLCNCPKTFFAGTKPDTAFLLSNGKTIVLCGYKNKGNNPESYSEFVLAVCGQDTIIDFWRATLDCQLHVDKDTLHVELLKKLPVGKDFNFEETVWSTEKIYFKGNDINRTISTNREIRTYNQTEIEIVLNTYKTEHHGINDNIMEIMYKIFVATISGSNEARRYFEEFKTKFGTLDGAYAEEYNELIDMLSQWDKYKMIN